MLILNDETLETISGGTTCPKAPAPTPVIKCPVIVVPPKPPVVPHCGDFHYHHHHAHRRCH